MNYLHKIHKEMIQILQKNELAVPELIKISNCYSYRKATMGSNLEAL